MTLHATAAMALVVAALAGPASASTETRTLSCPEAASEQLSVLGDRLGVLEDQMQMLDDQLQSLSDARAAALEQAKSRIEDVARETDLSQEQIQAMVDDALAQAQAQGEAAARAASAARRAMAEVKAQMQLLHQQMHAVQSHHPRADAAKG